MALLNFRKRAGRDRDPRKRRARGAAGRLLDRGHAAHRREGRGFPRPAARGHARLHRPYRRHADRGHGRRPPSASPSDGYPVMPHFPARIIKDRATLADWIARYQGEAGVDQALLLAGGVAAAAGRLPLPRSQLIETGLFDKAGFKRLHVAGHPEGNRDIDPDGTNANVSTRPCAGNRISRRTTDAKMAIATQFAFDAEPDHRAGPTRCARPASPCRSISASRGRPSCRR